MAVRNLLRGDDDARKLIEIGKEESMEKKEKVAHVLSSQRYEPFELELFDRKKQQETGSQDTEEAEGGQQQQLGLQ